MEEGKPGEASGEKPSTSEEDIILPDQIDLSKFVTPKRAAEILGVSLPTVYDAMRAGKLPAHKIPTLILLSDVEAYQVRPNKARGRTKKE